MGDTGSLVIGFMISVMAIELLNCGVTYPEIAVSPVLLIAILFIPLYDITRVFLIRILNGSSPFRADRNHMHHLMLGFGFGHRSVALIMTSMSLLSALLPQLFNYIPTNLIMIGMPVIVYLILHPKILGTFAAVHHNFFGNSIDRHSSGNIR